MTTPAHSAVAETRRQVLRAGDVVAAVEAMCIISASSYFM